jgi:hypothetical protein
MNAEERKSSEIYLIFSKLGSAQLSQGKVRESLAKEGRKGWEMWT